jgi:hypothetical protein
MTEITPIEPRWLVNWRHQTVMNIDVYEVPRAAISERRSDSKSFLKLRSRVGKR